jgi:glutathione peroxidase
MGNILDLEFETMNGEKTTLRTLGESDTKNWLVVNVASACGFTRQYEQLQEKSTQDGITVVGFPCNQFGGQEPGTHQEICDFTSSKYSVDFPLMAKLEVKGENQHPLFAELNKSTGADGHTGDIRWNFEKFVISIDGTVARFSSRDSPLDIV